jgi:hypothetical protein
MLGLSGKYSQNLVRYVDFGCAAGLFGSFKGIFCLIGAEVRQNGDTDQAHLVAFIPRHETAFPLFSYDKSVYETKSNNVWFFDIWFLDE